jgi:thiol:disulfide interchange protein DsbA
MVIKPRVDGMLSSTRKFFSRRAIMLRRFLSALLILLPLAACAQSSAPPATPAVATTVAPAAAANSAPAAAATVASAATVEEAAVASAATVATAAAESAVLPMPTGADAPRLGTDYEILPSPQPTWGQGKIEVAEVFSYACIHCAQFQPVVNTWLPKLSKDVRYEYVPAIFNPMWENFARAYFAAKVLGVQAKTHDAVFKAVHIDHSIKAPTLEDIADWYATQGVDRTKFLDTMNSFGVNAMISHAKQFSLRTGISGTPTMIIAGKYRVNVTTDRGFSGMLATVDFLLARERAMSSAK